LLELRMNSSASDGQDRSSELLIELVEVLELHGLPSDSYQLHDVVDVEALEGLIASSAGGMEVQFIVEGVQVVVTEDGVAVSHEGLATSSSQ
jgi:hypothetical protein